MPNWCSNTLTLSHEDPKQIARAVKAFKESNLLNEFHPNPTGEWQYEWSVENWGTKWDVGDDYEPDVTPDGLTVTMSFDSAWAPPVPWYEHMQDLGFQVEAMYYEPGMAFAGKYDADGDDYYEFSEMSSDEIRKELPQELDDMFGIADAVQEFEDEEPLTDWYVAGAKEKGLIKDGND